MVIATADSGKHLFLGLSFENLRRLKEGHPIHLTRQSHGMAVPEGMSIIIAAGESEQAIAEMLKKAGAIGPETVVNQQRPV